MKMVLIVCFVVVANSVGYCMLALGISTACLAARDGIPINFGYALGSAVQLLAGHRMIQFNVKDFA